VRRPRADLAGAVLFLSRWAWPVRSLTSLCLCFLAAARSEGEPGVLPPRFDGVHAGAAQEGDNAFLLPSSQLSRQFILRLNLRMDCCISQTTDTKSVKAPQSASAKKRRDPEDAVTKSAPDSNGENGSVAALSLSETENKPRDEMAVLREQIDELQKKLLEKEEALRSAENLVSEMNEAYSTIDELRRQTSEKEALIRFTNSQLQDAKVINYLLILHGDMP
jgi:hypothetical protein